MSNINGSCNPLDNRDGVGVTTLYIRSLTGKLKHDELLCYFSAFGDVNSVRIRNKPKYSYGFVKFNGVECAAEALRDDIHLIAGRKVKIAVADDRYKDVTTLLDLNDDCILEILSMKCLSARDLCSAAETCRRLKIIASRVFKSEYKTCDLDFLSKGYSAEDLSTFEWREFDYFIKRNTKTAKRILMNFGSVIRHLKIVGDRENEFGEWSRKVLTSATEYCSSTLESLELFRFKIPENFLVKLKPLFNNFQKLEVYLCTFDGVSKELFSDCGSLVELRIRNYDNVLGFILDNTFPKLELFDYWNSKTDLDSVESFISRHKNLKSLQIWDVVKSSMLPLIAGYSRLETLTCYIPDGATLDLSNLGHLKKLHLGFDNENVLKKTLGLENLKFLVDLKFESARLDSEAIRALSQLQRLQQLELSWFTKLQNWNQLGDLGQLTTLKIDSNEIVDLDVVLLVKRLSKLALLKAQFVEMDLETYLRLVDVVRRRPDQTKLTFRLFYKHEYEALESDFARDAHLVEIAFM